MAVLGEVIFDLSQLVAEWDAPKFDLAQDARVVVAPDGSIVGYETLFRVFPNGLIKTDGYIHPAYVGQGIGTHLVQWAEAGGEARIFRALEFPPVDVDALPVPRYDLLEGLRHNRITVQTSRGCPWRCDFCASSVMLSQRYRVRAVENVVRDLDAVCRLWPRPFVEFADDEDGHHRYDHIDHAVEGIHHQRHRIADDRDGHADDRVRDRQQ